MQRPNNATGPGGTGLWTTEMRLGVAGNNFTGQNRNLQHPTAATLAVSVLTFCYEIIAVA